MPVYEYKCPSCGRVEELMCSFSKRPKHIKCTCLTNLLPTLMSIIPSIGSFVMTGYRAANGYSVSEDISKRK